MYCNLRKYKPKNIFNIVMLAIGVACLSSVSAQQQTDTLIIFFAINEASVDNQSAEQLNMMVIGNTDIVSISVLGYTDFLGSVAYNYKLSEKRSDNVRNYLINKGVDKNIIFSKGNGVHPNSVEKNRQDPSDKGIKAHRIVQVVYTTKKELSEENHDTNKLSEENLVPNNIIVLENILFYPREWRFRPDSYQDLMSLLEIMQKHPTLKIEIQGHICCYGDDSDPISLNRAKAVFDYLVERGIDPNRMRYKGFGATRKRYPLEQNEYEENMNRRVEIFILEI